MQIPSLQTLRAFEAAGRLQSYSRAGDEIGLTHGAVSRRIRDLEALTGKRLFERRGNCMVPTSDGTRLLAQVRNAIGLLESIFAPPDKEGRAGLTLTMFPAIARWLVPRLGGFRAANPDLDLKLDVESKVVELGQGVDAALRYGSGSWPRTVSRLLARETLFPAASPAYLARHAIAAPADLLQCNLLRHPWHSWAAWFHAAGVAAGEPRQGPEYSDSALLLEAAEAGEGVALVRGLGAADALRAGRLQRLFAISVPDEHCYFFVRPAGARDTRLEPLESWLAAELQDAAEDIEAAH